MPNMALHHAIRRAAARKRMMADPIGRSTVEQYQEVKSWFSDTSEWTAKDFAYARKALSEDRREARKELLSWY